MRGGWGASVCPCLSWSQACSVAVLEASFPGYCGLIKENPWNSSWSRFWITSSSGGVSTGGWRVKKRSKFSASRPHCWGGWGGMKYRGGGGRGGVGMDRSGWSAGGGTRGGKQKEGEWWGEPGCEMTSLEHGFKYQKKVPTRSPRVSLPFSRYSKHIQQFTQQGQRSLERPVAVHDGHATRGNTVIFNSGEEKRSFCFGAT